ncbi:MAG: Nudix family hydrolase [Zoogloeaceae bacterium]|nr:Nudix family hydrolase [Zoogloeaceae bacterium]
MNPRKQPPKGEQGEQSATIAPKPRHARPPLVKVAAAVILSRDHQSCLLACRPEDKAYAGYWEFPGGKIEPGEDVKTALIREIHEELGIRVTKASPWITRSFLYPDALTRIHFWRVTDWKGKIDEKNPVEHSALAWVPISLPCQTAPLLPANTRVFEALAMPTQMLITHAWEEGTKKEIARVESALSQGVRMILVREQALPTERRPDFLRAVVKRARRYDARVLVSETGDGSGSELSRLAGANGIHLTSHALTSLSARPDFPCVGASCHNAEEIRAAEQIGVDYATLGPVLPTPSHPDQPGLGWEAFAALALDISIPIYAIGGQSRDTLATAQQHGAHGVACMRKL